MESLAELTWEELDIEAAWIRRRQQRLDAWLQNIRHTGTIERKTAIVIAYMKTKCWLEVVERELALRAELAAAIERDVTTALVGFKKLGLIRGM